MMNILLTLKSVTFNPVCVMYRNSNDVFACGKLKFAILRIVATYVISM